MNELVKQLVDGILKEDTKIKKVVGIYGGRFQPFGPHHLKTYKWLERQVDEAYITTSNLKKPPRHPMNFKEKVRHMSKMGVPSNKIIMEKSPYVAKNLAKKFDEETTVFVYIFGAKDAGRLGGGGKYFQDFKKNKKNLKGHGEHGYYLVAPHVSIKVGGKEVSGTTMRALLGSPKVDDSDREKLFKKMFGYFNDGIFAMMTNKFKKLFEINEIEVPIKIGDTVLMGKFKNKKVVVKSIEFNEKGDLKINGKSAARFRLIPQPNIFDEQLDEVSGVTGGVGNGGIPDHEPPTGFTRPNKKRRIGKDAQPDLWFKEGGYEQLHFPKADNPFGASDANYRIDTKKVAPVKNQPWIDVPPESEDYIDKTELKDIFSKDWWKDILLTEGGAYGHMAHPFDDKNLKFADLKHIIVYGLGGQLNREDNVTEKLDGQNLMVSWIDGKLKVARNKGHIKNFGKTSLDAKGVKLKFAGRGDIADAFNFAVTDMSKAIGSLSEKQRTKIFNNGQHWMNLEVMWPKSANVIDYDVAEIVFHGALQYDEKGNVIGEVKGSGRMLAGMIKQVNQDIQKHYTISKPVFLTVSKHQDFGKMKKKFLNRVDKLKKTYGLKDSDTLAMYHQTYWEEFIYNAGKQFKYTVPKTILKNLTKRWAFFDKSYKIPNIKNDLKKQPEFLDWVLSTDKKDHAKMVKENMRPFEVLFFELGAEILKNVEGFIAVNPSKTVQSLRKDVNKAISDLKSGGDVKKLSRFKTQLDRFQSIGGAKAIVPSEGLVFKYKGNTYKFTGAFAPVNQIMGLINF